VLSMMMLFHNLNGPGYRCARRRRGIRSTVQTCFGW
jgi:hypothetical protein